MSSLISALYLSLKGSGLVGEHVVNRNGNKFGVLMKSTLNTNVYRLQAICIKYSAPSESAGHRVRSYEIVINTSLQLKFLFMSLDSIYGNTNQDRLF